MGYSKRKLSLWIAVNIAGMIVFLWAASALWVCPGEEGTPGGPGDAFYFLFFLLPILVAFAALNLVTLIATLREVIRNRVFSPFVVWVLVIALWSVLLAFDRYKTFRVIDAAYV